MIPQPVQVEFNPADRNPADFAELIPSGLSVVTIKLAWILSVQAYVDVVDFSHWNYSVGREPDYAIVKANGFDVVIHKITESDWFVDDKFDIGWRSCLDNDLIPLGYHFFDDRVGGFTQAHWCISNCAEYLKAVDGKTILFDDIEVMHNHITQIKRQNRAKAYNETIVEEGFLTGNYSSKYLWEMMMGTQPLSWVNKYDQWVANWTPASSPLKPIGWLRDDWWQYAVWGKHSWAKYVGTDGNVDVSRMYGTVEDLKNKLGITPELPPDCCEEVLAALDEIRKDIQDLSGRVTQTETGLSIVEGEQTNMAVHISSLKNDVQILAGNLMKVSDRVDGTESNIKLINELLDRIDSAFH